MAASMEARRVSLLQIAPIVVLVLFVADFGLAVIYLANFMIGHSIAEVNAFVDLNGERNLPTWYSSTKPFAIAACLGLLAWIERSSIGSWLFAALTLVFLALSADETIQAHEVAGHKLDALLPGGDRQNTVFVETGIWMFVLGVPGVAAIALLFWYARSLLRVAPAAFTKCLAGLAVFTAGALGVETLSNFTMRGSAAHVMHVTAEELLEMVGATILLWGCLDLLQAWNIRLELDRS